MDNLFSFCLLAFDCPPGWDEFGDSCYKFMMNFFYSVRLNWNNARAVCQGLEGDLVSIDNEMEMEFVNNISSMFKNTDMCIGLNDRLKEGQFVWSDGTPFNNSRSYSNWRDGQPDNSGNEDCVVLNNNKWYDEPCSDTDKYICERPKGRLPRRLIFFRNPNYIHLDKA